MIDLIVHNWLFGNFNLILLINNITIFIEFTKNIKIILKTCILMFILVILK